MKKILYTSLIIILSSCSSFLKEYSQDTDYVRSWKDLDELLIGDCYLPIEEYTGTNMLNTTGSWINLLTDEIEEYQSTSNSAIMNGDEREKCFGYFTWQQHVGENEKLTSFFAENETWTKIYRHINVANNILASVEDVPSTKESDIQGIHKVKGEAHFLRAYYYFWLANCYGKPYNANTSAEDLCVPIKTSAMVEDKKFSRNTVEEVYQLIIDDLNAAEEHLTAYTTPKVSIYRADKTACHLLQSRVYLYMQQWTKAAEYAKKVMDEHPALEDLNTTSEKFSVKSNPENIFSMGGNTTQNLFCNSPFAFSVSNELYSSYSEADLRKKQWYYRKGQFIGPIRTTLNIGQTAYDFSAEDFYSRAYQSNRHTYEVSGLFLMRSAEAYLNYAEAEAYLGHETEALEAINTLRKNRISANAQSSVSYTGNSLISFIRKERRLEMPLEGHRWFDLRRYTVCEVMPESKEISHEWTYYSSHTSAKKIEVRRFTLLAFDEAYTLPIPREVIEFNTGMADNIRPVRSYISVEF